MPLGSAHGAPLEGAHKQGNLRVFFQILGLDSRPSGSEGLTVVLPPQRVHEVHIRLALLPMSGSDFALDMLPQLQVASTHLNIFQFDLGSKVDVAEHMENLSHHGIEARRVHTTGLVGFVGHIFLLSFLFLGPRDGGVNLD
jgi:hypothetical protein